MRSEQEKWRVPESDPAGHQERDRLPIPKGSPGGPESRQPGDRGNLIFCGMCGALNPSTNFYCAACGTTLVDAFHASEGLRVFELPDAASRIIDIVRPGTELDVAEDPDAPSDYVRIRLPHGRLGYIRMAEVAALTSGPASAVQPPSSGPNINTNARGCVSPLAALASLALLVMLSTFGFYLISREDADSGFLMLVACLVIAPLAILMIFLYLMARDREEQLEMDAVEGESTE